VQLEKNYRLYWAFSICEELGVDDPIAWMNGTSPRVLDWWIAYRVVKSDREAKAAESARSGSTDVPLSELSSHFESKINGVERPRRGTVLRGDPRS
jgi:hypothetical protein